MQLVFLTDPHTYSIKKSNLSLPLHYPTDTKDISNFVQECWALMIELFAGELRIRAQNT